MVELKMSRLVPETALILISNYLAPKQFLPADPLKLVAEVTSTSNLHWYKVVLVPGLDVIKNRRIEHLCLKF